MTTLDYLHNENLHENIKTLIDRHIDFSISYSAKGDAKLTINDEFSHIITEFCLGIYFHLDNQSLGFQVYGNGSNYFHKSNELITDPQFASEVLAKAKQNKPDLPWHIKLSKASEIINPQLLHSNKQDQFYLEPTSNGFKVFYPQALGGFATLVTDEQKGYEILINTRNHHPSGNKFHFKDNETCAQSLWKLFGQKNVKANDCLSESFLHFSSGTSRFDVMH